jgi:hypothetical protein
MNIVEWEKQLFQSQSIPGKGQNEILEIAIPLVQTRVATKAVQLHVSENRGTEVKHMHGT